MTFIFHAANIKLAKSVQSAIYCEDKFTFTHTHTKRGKHTNWFVSKSIMHTRGGIAKNKRYISFPFCWLVDILPIERGRITFD